MVWNNYVIYAPVGLAGVQNVSISFPSITGSAPVVKITSAKLFVCMTYIVTCIMLIYAS